MLYNVYHLGFIPSGQILTIQLNQQAYIMLIDEKNFQTYARHHHNYYAKGQLQSYYTEKYTIPYDDFWHLVVELGETNVLVNINFS